MNLDEIPVYQPDMNQLKDQLNLFCTQNEITKFEADEIIELLADGETVDWLVDQLRTENEAIDVGALTGLLNAIQAIVAPPAEEAEPEMEEEAFEIIEAEPLEIAPPIPDLSQLDLSQLEDLLPPGMKLPPGVNMKQIQQIMQSPQGEFLADFSLFCQEKGLADIQGTMADPIKLQELNDEWLSTPRATFDGKTPAEMLEANPALMPQKVETYRREEPRVGRNDPCPCGSGKKYKKCCGQG